MRPLEFQLLAWADYLAPILQLLGSLLRHSDNKFQNEKYHEKWQSKENFRKLDYRVNFRTDDEVSILLKAFNEYNVEKAMENVDWGVMPEVIT